MSSFQTSCEYSASTWFASHQHCAMFYSNPDELLATVVPYLKEGLEHRQKCFCITDDRTNEKILASLQAGGIDVASVQARGALFFSTQRNMYLRNGRLEPSVMIEYVRRAAQQAQADGFSVLRIVSEVICPIGTEWKIEQAAEYDAQLNDLFAEYDLLALCIYHVDHFDAQVICDVIHTHPFIVIRNEICRNPCFIPPRQFLAAPIKEKVQLLLDNLAEAEHTWRHLQESEKRFHRIVQNADAGYVFIDTEGVIREINEAAITMDPGLSRPQILDHLFTEFVFPEDVSSLTALFKDVMNGKSIHSTEIRRRRIDGSLARHEATLWPVYQDEQIVGMEGFLIDVTEPKRVEETLRFSEARLRERIEERTAELAATNRQLQAEIEIRQRTEEEIRARQKQYETLANLSPVGIFHTDPEGKCLYVNRQWCEITGLSIEQARGRWWEIGLSPEECERTLQKWRRSVQEHRPFRLEHHFQRPDGSITWVVEQTTAVESSNGEITGYVGTLTDITNRKVSEERLRNSEERLRTVIETSKDAIVAINEQGQIILYNPAAENLFGYSREEMLEQPLDRILPELLRDQHRGFVTDFMRTGEPSNAIGKTLDLEAQHKDGQKIQLELTLSVGHCENEKFVLAIIRDTTQRRMTEKLLKQAHERLQQSKRLASIGTLAAGIAHEINNPIGAILLAAQVAEKSYGRPDQDQIFQECLDDITSNAKRCGQIVKSVLQFSRLESAEKWSADLNEVVERCVQLCRPHAEEQGARLTMEVARDLPRITMNPLQIEQVVVNLIRNAIESADQQVQVHVSTRAGPRGAQIVVRDNGRGIPPEHHGRLFDPFFTTRQQKGGTGLGLSIVHGIISEHGGGIRFESALGKGTTFFVDLRADSSSQEKPHA